MTSFSEKICLFLLDAYVVSCPTQTRNLRKYLGIRDRVQIKMCSIAISHRYQFFASSYFEVKLNYVVLPFKCGKQLLFLKYFRSI